MAKPPRMGKISAEPDLTPMLDLSFQLITFFMMLMNFSKDDYDQRVHLPVAGSAKPVEIAGAESDRLVLNIDREGNLLLAGQVYDLDRALREINTQAQLVRLNLEVAGGKKLRAGEPLPTTLVIRADRVTPYGRLYRIISATQAQGFRKFALKAMNQE